LVPEAKTPLSANCGWGGRSYAILSDNGRAIEILDGLLSWPSDVTVPLKLNPVWDPLRNDPRFQALIDKYGAKA
jgi:hypothetical protein